MMMITTMMPTGVFFFEEGEDARREGVAATLSVASRVRCPPPPRRHRAHSSCCVSPFGGPCSSSSSHHRYHHRQSSRSFLRLFQASSSSTGSSSSPKSFDSSKASSKPPPPPSSLPLSSRRRRRRFFFCDVVVKTKERRPKVVKCRLRDDVPFFFWETKTSHTIKVVRVTRLHSHYCGCTVHTQKTASNKKRKESARYCVALTLVSRTGRGGHYYSLFFVFFLCPFFFPSFDRSILIDRF